MNYNLDFFNHLIAGGIGGTLGAVVTCPLEVVKTRQQSSLENFNFQNKNSKLNFSYQQIWYPFKHIVETEGKKALFKGLGTNVIGVAPSRSIYFCTYSSVKNICNESFVTPDSPLVHFYAAGAAGFVSSTLTNPIWFIKTRIQLDHSKLNTAFFKQIKSIYDEVGFKGFYKGITASYFGISETIIHFVIYEYIKNRFKKSREKNLLNNNKKNSNELIQAMQFMIAGAISKTCASILAYPHEVVRTRLRQKGTKYKKFFQSLFLIYNEEGRRGLYRGLCTHLIRQIPNTIIMMVTYEYVVIFLRRLESKWN